MYKEINGAYANAFMIASLGSVLFYVMVGKEGIYIWNGLVFCLACWHVQRANSKKEPQEDRG